MEDIMRARELARQAVQYFDEKKSVLESQREQMKLAQEAVKAYETIDDAVVPESAAEIQLMKGYIAATAEMINAHESHESFRASEKYQRDALSAEDDAGQHYNNYTDEYTKGMKSAMEKMGKAEAEKDGIRKEFLKSLMVAELQLFSGYLGKELTVKSESQSCDWEGCRSESYSSTGMVLDAILERNGCLYLAGHDEYSNYIVASKHEKEDKDQESVDKGEITEIIAEGKPTGLASILKKLSKPEPGPNMMVDKKERRPNSGNTFLRISYLEGNGFNEIVPKRCVSVLGQIVE